LSTNSIENNFGIASLRAWHDLEKKRFSPQDFRSFVQTALENAGINPNIIAPVLGHKAHGIDFHYSEHDITDLMQKFRTALPYLLPESIENLKAETQKEIAEEKKKVNNLEYDNNSLKKEVNKFTSEKETMKKEIGSLQKRVDDIAFSLQKQSQIRIRKQQAEAQATDTQEQAEIRETDNLDRKEKKAQDLAHYASKDYYKKKNENEQ
jgi:seryl-tRNA synthetase